MHEGRATRSLVRKKETSINILHAAKGWIGKLACTDGWLLQLIQGLIGRGTWQLPFECSSPSGGHCRPTTSYHLVWQYTLLDYIVTARSVSCFKRSLLNYANNVGNDFLLLVTISIVWYVFLAFNNLFFLFDVGRAPVSEDLDLPWCPMYFTYCLITL